MSSIDATAQPSLTLLTPPARPGGGKARRGEWWVMPRAWEGAALASIESGRNPASAQRCAMVLQAALRGRYWIASARCVVSISSLPARSAMVRASFRIR